MIITFKPSKFEAGRAKALAHAMNASWRIEDNEEGNWTAQNLLEVFGRHGIVEKLQDYQKYMFTKCE